jgi:hypothetical protein
MASSKPSIPGNGPGMKVNVNDHVRPGRTPLIGQLIHPVESVQGGGASLKLSEGSDPPKAITTCRSSTPPAFTIVTVTRTCCPNTTCVGDTWMLTLKSTLPSPATPGAVGDVR